MERRECTRQLLIMHYQSYPELQICDIFKFLYHSAFGCEHLVSSLETAIKYIEDEYACMVQNDGELIVPLDGAYSRVSLAYMHQGLCARTFAKLFVASSKKEENGRSDLLQGLEVAKELVCRGVLPFSKEDFEEAVKRWAADNYPAVHHSENYRETYHPAYRVIANEYIPFLPLFAQMDKLITRGRALIAIEGGSASGKTTLSRLLEDIYPCTMLHMDDFFLPPEKRTKERFAQVGGNVDWERFLEEVLKPISEGKPFDYRKFDCFVMSVGAQETIRPENLVVVEGAYSMHPALERFYDFSVFLDISSELQRERILKRNTPQMAQRFFGEWIPLENTYFRHTRAKERCDMCVKIL